MAAQNLTIIIMRKLYGKPVGHITSFCYPDKLTLDEFVEQMKHVETFARNMQNLNNTDDRYIEDWFQLFANWSEIEQE